MALYYRKIYPSMWTDERVYNLESLDKLVLSYLFTGQANRIGLYFISIGKAAEETGMEISDFKSRMKNVVKVMGWEYDEVNRVVWIPKWWRYNSPATSKNLIGNLKDFHDLPKTSLRDKFLANVADLQPYLQAILIAFAKGELKETGDEKDDATERKSNRKNKPSNSPKPNATDEMNTSASVMPSQIGSNMPSKIASKIPSEIISEIASNIGSQMVSLIGSKMASAMGSNMPSSEAEAEAEAETKAEDFNTSREQNSAAQSDAPGTADALPPDPARPGPSAFEDLALWTFPLKNGSEWMLMESKVKQWEGTYPDIDVRQECRKAWQWIIDNPKERKTEVGMPTYLNTWLKRQKPSGNAYASPMVKNLDVVVSTPSGNEPYDPKTAPVPFNSPEFRRSWVRWCEYMVQVGKPVNRHVIEATAEEAEKWGEQNFIDMVQNSVSKGYKSLVPLDDAIPEKMPKPKPAESNDSSLMPWELARLQEIRRTAPRPPVTEVQS